jgi:outer membrane protein assembly factor BamB
VPYDDAIIFNTESCTIFAVHAETGKMLWSYWLGDPLMSTPTVAGGKVYTVYPARGSGGGAALPANQPETPTGSQLVAGSDDKSESPDDDASPDAFTKKGSLLKAFDVDDKDVPQLPKKSRAPAPYVAICLDAMTGKILWQRWVDGDCMSAPVAVGEEVYITTLPGTVYKFRQTDGEILSARRERATSAPVIVAGGLYYTKRIDDEDGEGTAREAIAIADQQTATVRVLANQRDAPYLDRAVQEKAASAVEANTFEQGNGIFGGFGGGFSGGGNLQGPADGEVQNSAPGDEPSDPPEDGTAAFDVNPFGVSPADNAPENLGNGGLDALAVQQQGAARNIGQGNVSMLQGYQGSRVLNWGRRNYNVMGDELVCTSAHSGKAQWRCPLSGDLKKVGGSLAAAPVPAGDHLLLATLEGNVLRVDPKTGKVHHRYEIGSPMRFSPAVDGGRIYVGTQDGRVVCIDTGDASVTGWPMWGGNAAHTGAN